jgi:hypothetical protein
MDLPFFSSQKLKESALDDPTVRHHLRLASTHPCDAVVLAQCVLRIWFVFAKSFFAVAARCIDSP